MISWASYLQNAPISYVNIPTASSGSMSMASMSAEIQQIDQSGGNLGVPHESLDQYASAALPQLGQVNIQA